jgi:hypothetical protein
VQARSFFTFPENNRWSAEQEAEVPALRSASTKARSGYPDACSSAYYQNDPRAMQRNRLHPAGRLAAGERPSGVPGNGRESDHSVEVLMECLRKLLRRLIDDAGRNPRWCPRPISSMSAASSIRRATG